MRKSFAIIALTILAVVSSVATVVATFDCKKLQVVGHAYDLSALARQITLESNATTPPTVTETKYIINPCAPLTPEPDTVPEADRCPENAWVCRSVTNYKKGAELRLIEVNSVAGSKKGDEPVVEARVAGDEPPSEFHWKMGGAQVEKANWATDIKFVCDKRAKNEDLPKVMDFKDGVLSLEWSVPAACALDDKSGGDKKPDDGNKDEDGERGKSSGGFFSTLLTIFVAVFMLYFVVGVMYKYLVVRASGLDLIPNLAFWREFPYLCADFAQHIWDAVGGRRRGGYSVV
ncbi:type II membrane protein [Coemansia spiralis]|uniref:Autophagy-related protein 27 n=2 Tax=Coemansia TaxID=4863 RepID=A0A9W8GBR2_9FUNG|nr:autophagy-related protein 27 [Coemansia spiralis]KAJ1990721.1 type II membrane protein [Coemansia umbellata]KAJ2621597.1 type II membrane protein [Coemansia sp. RSA 1358]KAJ2680155.1 type II membrane protein [Coemansia spiralis]